MQVEIESLKKTESKLKLEMKNLGSQTKTSDVSFTNRAEDTEEGILGIEEKVKEMDMSVKQNFKISKTLGENIQEIRETMKRQNLQML